MAARKSVPPSSDAVVIGAGLGGLVCALEMQRHDLQVTIVEKRPTAGGYAHHFRRKSHIFDASLHHIGGLGEGGMTYRVLEPLGVLDRLEFEKTDRLMTCVFPDATYEIPNSPREIIEYLGGLFPDEKDGLVQLFDYSYRLKDHVVGPVLYPDFDIPVHGMLAMENVDAVLDELISRFIRSPRLKAVLTQQWMYLGLPSTKSSANFSNCVFASGYLEGGYRISGGSDALVKALVGRFEEEGGILITGNGATGIRTAGKKTRAVVLEDGSDIGTGLVAANASPLDVFPGLVEASELAPIFLHRLETMEASCSAYASYIALDCPASDLGIPEGNTFINGGDDQEAAWADCRDGRLDRTDWCLTNPKDHGLSIVEITDTGDWLDLDDREYRQRKENVKNTLLAKYDKRYPGLIEHAEVIEFGTPRTLRRYSSNAGGALYGFAQTPGQANNRRISNRTPIGGLYLCGAWTQAGGGFEGTMMTGMKTAHMILAEAGRKWDSGMRYADRLAESEERRAAFGSGATGGTPDSAAREIPFAAPDFSTPDYPFYRNLYEVYPDDTDWTGSAKETAYLRFMDRARVRLLDQSEELGAIRPLLDSYHVKLYSVSAHIHDRLSVGELATIQTGYKKATSHRAAVDQHISAPDGRTILTGRAEIMFVTRKEELVELPPVYREHGEMPFESPDACLPPLLYADLSGHSYTSEFLISYEDTDMQGVVYNVAYIKIAQKMFWELRNDVLPDGADVSKIRVEHISIRFMTAARLQETIVVKARRRPIDERRFGLDFRMTLKETGATLTDIHLEYILD